MRIVLAELGQHATTQALGSELDRSERILDLVCEAACDFGPGGFAAGAIDHGGIVENRDRAFVGQAGAQGGSLDLTVLDFAGTGPAVTLGRALRIDYIGCASDLGFMMRQGAAALSSIRSQQVEVNTSGY